MSTRNEGLKHLWLRANLERLQWLSKIKVQYSIDINNKFIENNKRTLVFCSSIEQSEMFPNTKSIHSRNKESLKNLDDFNNGIINNITAVNSLNEGVNLVNCQIGIFNIINASEIMTIQKVGRILRHTKPILLIPYFSGTREEELVKDMMEHYSKESIKHILNVQQIIV
jgi:superfamily II DNA or RNA helicase